MLSQRLAELSIALPKAAAPAGAYVAVKREGNLIYVAGQLPFVEGKLLATGTVPSGCSIEMAAAAARQCVINALAAVAGGLGSVDLIKGALRVGAFVASDLGFTQQPVVANGASELLVQLLGEPGRHVRAAVGVNVLPLGAAVEIDFIFQC